MSAFLNKLGGGYLLLSVVSITVLIYWPGLHGGFFFDDYPNIIDNAEVLLGSIGSDELLAATFSGVSGLFGRPVSQLSFALNYYFHGFSPFYFKLTNLLIHCINACLVYCLVFEVLRAIQARLWIKNISFISAGVAAAWMIHPIQLSSVLYVVQRMTSLSACFLLIALILHLIGRRDAVLGNRGRLLLILAWGLAWPLSVLSKESGVLFLGFVVAYELIILRNARGGLDTIGVYFKYLLIALMFLLPLYLLSPLGAWLISGYEMRTFSLAERLMTEARIFWIYLRLILFPGMESFGLYHDDIAVSSDLLTPLTTLPAIFGVGVVGILGFLSRNRFPLAAFGVAWFFIGHSLESTFIPLELAHEHRNYLPLLGVCFVLVVVVDYLIKQPGVKRTIGATLIVAFLVYCALLTALRSEMFRNDQVRTQIEAQHHVDSARANFEAGRALAGAFDQDKSNMFAYTLAKKHFERAIDSDKSFKLGYFGLLSLDCSAFKRVDPRIVDELARNLHVFPFTPEDRNLMGAISTQSIAGNFCLTREQTEKIFSAALLNPRTPSVAKVRLYMWLADYLWLSEKDLPSAKIAVGKALDLEPMDPTNRFKWAQLVFISGEKQEARQLLEELRQESFTPEQKKAFNELLISLDGSTAQKIE